jgi:hypothetical protein
MIRLARVVGSVHHFKRQLKDMASNFFVEDTSQSVILNLREATRDNDSQDLHKLRITLSRLLPFWDTCAL